MADEMRPLYLIAGSDGAKIDATRARLRARAEREGGKTLGVVRRQLRGSIPPGCDGRNLVVAYEPVWAIGTGRNASGADAAAMAIAIRLALDDTPGGAVEGLQGSATPILYGGSVTTANIGQFFAEPEIDGALVGGASLKPDEMAGIVARAGLTAQARGLAG